MKLAREKHFKELKQKTAKKKGSKEHQQSAERERRLKKLARKKALKKLAKEKAMKKLKRKENLKKLKRKEKMKKLKRKESLKKLQKRLEHKKETAIATAVRIEALKFSPKQRKFYTVASNRKEALQKLQKAGKKAGKFAGKKAGKKAVMVHTQTNAVETTAFGDGVWNLSSFRSEVGSALTDAVGGLTGGMADTVKSMSSKLAQGVQAVSDIKKCTANPKQCAKDHCPGVVKSTAKAVAAGGKASAVTEAAALCGSLAGQFGLLFAPMPPVALLVATAVGTYCTAEVTKQINKGVDLASASFASATCGAIFDHEELELLVRRLRSQRQSERP